MNYKGEIWETEKSDLDMPTQAWSMAPVKYSLFMNKKYWWGKPHPTNLDSAPIRLRSGQALRGNDK